MPRRSRGKEIKGKRTKDKPKCKIYIFCEGQTERIYLEHFENRLYNVQIIPVNTEHTDAYGIVKYARQYIDKADLDLELGDRGYCVFDSDPKSNPNIKDTFNLLRGYKNKGLDCIFSNPCFEVWFALHFGNVPYSKDAKGIKKHVKDQVKSKLGVLDYSETTDIYQYLQEWQQEAVKRAKILHNNQMQVHETVYSHECNPYTDMFYFIEYMEEIRKQNTSSESVV